MAAQKMVMFNAEHRTWTFYFKKKKMFPPCFFYMNNATLSISHHHPYGGGGRGEKNVDSKIGTKNITSVSNFSPWSKCTAQIWPYTQKHKKNTLCIFNKIKHVFLMWIDMCYIGYWKKAGFFKSILLFPSPPPLFNWYTFGGTINTFAFLNINCKGKQGSIFT